MLTPIVSAHLLQGSKKSTNVTTPSLLRCVGTPLQSSTLSATDLVKTPAQSCFAGREEKHANSLSFREALTQLEDAHAREISKLSAQIMIQTPEPSQLLRTPAACSQLAAPSSPLNAGLPLLTCGADGASPRDIPWSGSALASKWAEFSIALKTKASILRPEWIPSISDLAFSRNLPLSAAHESLYRRINSNLAIAGGIHIDHYPETLAPKKKQIKVRGPLKTLVGKAVEVQPMHPASVRKLYWDVVGMLICVYEVVLMPLALAHLWQSPEPCVIGVCVYWTLDLFVTFATGYYHSHGHIERRWHMIAWSYIKTWFVIDFTLTAIDWFIVVTGDNLVSTRASKSIFRLIRVSRLLRLLKLAPKLQDQLGRVTSQFMFALTRVGTYIALIVLFNHYVACLWYSTWSDPILVDEVFTDAYKYLVGLHWAFAHCFLGSMDIIPNTAAERLCTCGVLVVSLIVFSILLSMITNDALTLRNLYDERATKKSLLMSFFGEHKIPPKLVCKIWHYINRNSLLEATTKHDERANKALEVLPRNMRKELMYAWFRPLLSKHPLFKFYDYMEPSAVMMLCQSAVKFTSLLPDEQLVWDNAHRLDHMIFVENGILEYHPFADGSVQFLQRGAWACEEALWSKTAMIFGQMKAGRQVCDLVMVSCHEFRIVADRFKLTLDFIMRYAREFISWFNLACQHFDDDDVLFNNSDIIANILAAATQRLSSVEKESDSATSLETKRNSWRLSYSTSGFATLSKTFASLRRKSVPRSLLA